MEGRKKKDGRRAKQVEVLKKRRDRKRGRRTLRRGFTSESNRLAEKKKGARRRARSLTGRRNI